VIIFGFRGKLKDQGEAVPAVCPRCHNGTFFHFMSRQRWFTLFFIPVFPYSSKHYIVCPVCSFSVALDAAGRERAGRMMQLTSQWRAGALSEEAYRAQVEAFTQGVMQGSVQALPPRQSGVPATATPSAPPPIPPPPTGPAPGVPETGPHVSDEGEPAGV
jgi:hypothetical protein